MAASGVGLQWQRALEARPNIPETSWFGVLGLGFSLGDLGLGLLGLG